MAQNPVIVSNVGNTAGNTGLSYGTVVLSGQANVTLSQVTGTNGNLTIGFSAPSQSNQQITAYATGNTTQSSTGTFNASSVIFRGEGVASVGVTNGSVVVSVPAGGGGLTNIRLSAGATSNLLSDVTFADSNGVSFGISASTMTASHNGLTSQSTQYLAITLGGNTAGTTTFHASNNASIFLHGGNNITLSGNGSSITVSAAEAVRSYFNWPEVVANSSAVQVSGSTKYIQPIEIPHDLSASFMRLPLTLSCVGSMASIATSANHTVGLTVSSTIQLAFYSLGVGANSLSLQSYFTTSTLWLQQATIGAAGTGSHWSSGHTISYPNASGANSSFTSSAATTLTNRTIQSSQLSDFTALRFLHIPMATSFSAGMYWMAYNSSTSLSTSGNANISTVRILASNFAVSQPAQSINNMGVATNSSILFPIGAGDWSTNSIGTTTGSIQLAALSRRASNPILYFDVARFA